jgi:hypothetical protein
MYTFIFSLLNFILKVDASCCVTTEFQTISPSNYYVNISVLSSYALNQNDRYIGFIGFPSNYVTNIEPPTSPNPFSCSPNSTLPGSYQCSSSGVKYFETKWRILTPNLGTGNPQVDVVMYGETCKLSATCALSPSGNVSFNGTTNNNPPAENSPGVVNLGALGKASASVFYPVLIFLILFLFVFAGFLINRRKKRLAEKNNNPDEEAKPTKVIPLKTIQPASNGIDGFDYNEMVATADENGYVKKMTSRNNTQQSSNTYSSKTRESLVDKVDKQQIDKRLKRHSSTFHGNNRNSLVLSDLERERGSSSRSHKSKTTTNSAPRVRSQTQKDGSDDDSDSERIVSRREINSTITKTTTRKEGGKNGVAGRNRRGENTENK